MTNLIIGIDPGINGGICVLQGNHILNLSKCPTKKNLKLVTTYDEYAMANLIKEYCTTYHNVKVYMELVHAMPHQGVTSMFTFGKGYGIWLGIFGALGLPYELVTPQEWKKKLIVGPAKDKQTSIALAKHLFPNIILKKGRATTDHDGMAEAALIAFYGGMKEWS